MLENNERIERLRRMNDELELQGIIFDAAKQFENNKLLFLKSMNELCSLEIGSVRECILIGRIEEACKYIDRAKYLVEILDEISDNDLCEDLMESTKKRMNRYIDKMIIYVRLFSFMFNVRNPCNKYIGADFEILINKVQNYYDKLKLKQMDLTYEQFLNKFCYIILDNMLKSTCEELDIIFLSKLIDKMISKLRNLRGEE